MWSQMSTSFGVFIFGLVLMPVQADLMCFYPNATLISLISNRVLLSTNPQHAGSAKSFSAADITLSLSPVGAILITQNSNGSALQLYSSGHNRNCTPECRLESKGDGNIIAYDTSGYYWSTGTCMTSEGPGCSGVPRQIILSAYWPYLLTPDSTCRVVWNISGAAQRHGAVVSTYTTPLAAVTPLSLSTFYTSFGVNSHISQGQNNQDVIKSMKYLGASTIRDGAVDAVVAVGLAGIKLNLGVGAAANYSQLQTTLAAIQDVHTRSNFSVVSIEGANELNNQPFQYGANPYASCSGYAQYQKDLYSSVKSNVAFKASGVVVYDLTAGNQGAQCATLGLLQLNGMADYANIHSYTYQYPLVTAGGDTYSGGMDNDYPTWNKTTPRVITEMGSHTWINADGSGVDELSQAKLVVSGLFNGIADGYSKIFPYQLIDQIWANYNGSESHFGLFNNDATPKLAAKVFNQTSSLLQDSNINSATILKSLSVSLIGVNQNVRTQLFQSQSRSLNSSTPVYWLAIWQNLPVWNPDKNIRLTNPTLPVTVSLGSVAGSFSVYNPFSAAGLPATGSPVLVKTVTGTQVGLDLPDYLQLIKISISAVKANAPPAPSSNLNDPSTPSPNTNTSPTPNIIVTDAKDSSSSAGFRGVNVNAMLIICIITASRFI